ncbi:MAG TPA: hypothetical protein VJU15_04720, partial [Gemmatimonadales bacterium]|nr:hypothetical protein [Gemmatimonadales bacterium]
MLATLAIILGAVGPTVRQSDGPTITLTNPTCKPCRVVRTEVLEVGADTSAQLLTPNGLLAIFAAGEGRYIGLPNNLQAPVVIDSRGRVIRSLGRKGSGPGEFQNSGPSSPWRGDSVLLGDAGSLRFSVFDTSLRYVRSFPMAVG